MRVVWLEDKNGEGIIGNAVRSASALRVALSRDKRIAIARRSGLGCCLDLIRRCWAIT